MSDILPKVSQKRWVLIPAWSQGVIGDAVARVFHSRGHNVIATGRNVEKIKHLEELGVTIIQLVSRMKSLETRRVKMVGSMTGGKLDVW